MKTASKKLVSRGMDGNLGAAERERLERLRREDPEIRQLERQWTAFGDQVRRVEAPVPDAERAWQDIRRAIRQTGDLPDPVPVSGGQWRFSFVSALAVLAVVSILGLSAWRLLSGTSPAWVAESEPETRVEWVVAEIPGATTMIYTDTETEMTVIWMDVVQNVDPKDS